MKKIGPDGAGIGDDSTECTKRVHFEKNLEKSEKESERGNGAEVGIRNGNVNVIGTRNEKADRDRTKPMLERKIENHRGGIGPNEENGIPKEIVKERTEGKTLAHGSPRTKRKTTTMKARMTDLMKLKER